jgi:hypothetical protein
MNCTISESDRNTSLSVAVKILEKWGCSSVQISNILRSNTAEERMLRVSYVLTAYSSLKHFFSCDASVYGWVNKTNNHPALGGASAMSVMASGDISDIKKIADIAIQMSSLN